MKINVIVLDAIYSNLDEDVSSILKNNSHGFGYSVEWCLRRTLSIFWTHESKHLHLFDKSPSHYLPRPIYKPCKELHLLFGSKPYLSLQMRPFKLKKLKEILKEIIENFEGNIEGNLKEILKEIL